MATTTKKESSSGKEKRGNSPSNGTTSTSTRRSSTGSTEKQIPNYLKPTISSCNEVARPIRNFRKTGPEDTSQRPDLLRRRSFDRPPSAARVHKALTSPAREKPKTLRSTTFGSKTSTAAAAASRSSNLEKVTKRPINAGKAETLSSSRSMKRNTTSTKKGSGSSASTKPPSNTNHDKKEAQNLKTKNHENYEETSLDDDHHHHQKAEEEVVKHVHHEDDLETPKSEGKDEVSDVSGNITQEVKSVEQENDHIPANVIPTTVPQEHIDVPQTEEKMEYKFEEEKSHDHIQKGIENDEDKEEEEEEEEKHNKEDTMIEEKIPDEEAKTETEVHEREGEGKEEDCVTVNVATSNEVGEEELVESMEKDDDEGRQHEEGAESSKEEIVEEAEVEAEATNNAVSKNRVEEGISNSVQ